VPDGAAQRPPAAEAVALRAVDRVADAEFLLGVYASTRAEELAIVPWTDAEKDAFLRMQFDAQDRYWREQRPDAAYDVIVVGGQPAGRLYVDRPAHEIRIVDIALLPEHRGSGVGTRLIAGVLQEGRASGRPVTIHVERGNRARGLYERLGFRQIDSTGVYDLLAKPAGEAAGGPPVT
jgi:ribosomal protein S18 acetylase RimI-like enzyme